jgi:GTP-binding protein
MTKIALIGQPNVGKSSLFNRIAKKRVAIVSDTAGTTRDVRRREVDILGRDALMLDTGGIDETNDAIFTHVKRKAIETAKEADIVLFMVDGKRLPDDKDKELFYELQALNKTIALVVNKIDNDKEKENLWDFYSFGIDEENLFGISVSHNRGTVALFEWLYEKLPEKVEIVGPSEDGYENQDEEIKKPKVDPNHIKIAIIGRPNVGKSSILNAIIGEERSVVSEIAGTTIDPVDETFKYNDKLFTFVDTAGLRRRGKILGLEKYALMRTEDMLAQSNVALLILDASDPLSDLDEKISGLVDKFGLGVIIVLNKWDEAGRKKKDQDVNDNYEKITTEIRRRFRFLYYAPIIVTSAKTGRSVDKLRDMIIKVFENYNKRITTAELNMCIKKALQRHALPSPHGNRLRIYFATQFNTNPPTVALVMNKPHLLHFSYKRYLINILREYLDFEGTPIRIVVRKKGERMDDPEFVAHYQELMAPSEMAQYEEMYDDEELYEYYDDEEYED